MTAVSGPQPGALHWTLRTLQLCPSSAFLLGAFVLSVLSDPMVTMGKQRKLSVANVWEQQWTRKGHQGLKQCLSDLSHVSKVTAAVFRAGPQVGNTLSAILKIAGTIFTTLSRNRTKICSILLQSDHNKIIGSKHTAAMAWALPMSGSSRFIPPVWTLFLAWEVLLCSCHCPSILLHCSSCKPSCHPASQEATKRTPK